MKEQKTICTECRYYKRVEGKDVWYNNVCLAPPQPEWEVDFITGKKKKPKDIHCRIRNPDGNCTFFEAKKKKKKKWF